MTFVEQTNRFRREIDEYIQSLSDRLSSDEQAELDHFLEHREFGVALHALAWIIVDSNKSLSRSEYDRLMELSDGLPDVEHYPPNLESHIEM